MLNAIANKCQQLGFVLTPHTIVIDFEQAAFIAIRNIFGQDVIIQSTWHAVQNLGLAGLYMQNEDVNGFISMMEGLAFLPIEHILNGIAYLQQNIPDLQLIPLLKYFVECLQKDTALAVTCILQSNAGTPYPTCIR